MSEEFLERSRTDGALFNLLSAYEHAVELAQNSMGINRAEAKKIAVLIDTSLESFFPHGTKPGVQFVKDKRLKIAALPEDPNEEIPEIVHYSPPGSLCVEIPLLPV
ncbi:MAG: hypothetical protein JWM99_3032 [Verrucomicrobiales bacterium]|nr:hypothetical protein [Verrucomicrobiales bacterium]